MQWAVIFGSLWKIFGPTLEALLEALLAKWLKRAAAELPPADTFPSEKAAQHAALDRTIQILPRLARVRKSLVRRMKAKLDDPITPEDEAEIRDLAEAADQE